MKKRKKKEKKRISSDKITYCIKTNDSRISRMIKVAMPAWRTRKIKGFLYGARTHARTHARTLARTHARTRTHTHAHTHTRTHTHTHTHKSKGSAWSRKCTQALSETEWAAITRSASSAARVSTARNVQSRYGGTRPKARRRAPFRTHLIYNSHAPPVRSVASNITTGTHGCQGCESRQLSGQAARCHLHAYGSRKWCVCVLAAFFVFCFFCENVLLIESQKQESRCPKCRIWWWRGSALL